MPFPENFNLRPFVWTQVEHDPENREARAAAVQGSLLADQKKLDNAEPPSTGPLRSGEACSTATRA